MIPVVQRGYALLTSGASSLQSPFLLAVRLYWGWQLIQTGWGKLNNIGNVVQFFTQLGIPAPALNAHFVAALEFGGGILLAAGIFSRLIALMMAGNMLVAYVTADREALFSFFSDPGKFYAAAPYTFLFASLVILIWGPGRFAVDALVAKWFEARSEMPSLERFGAREVRASSAQ